MDYSGVVKSFEEVQGELVMRISLDKSNITKDDIDNSTGKRTRIKVLKDGQGRTLRQNNLMWKIISEIDKGMNGVESEDGRWEIYTLGIEMLGVEYQDFQITEKALDFFKKNFRRCRVIQENGDKMIIRCYTGSSKFNKQQMGELIDWFINYASKLRIPVMQYRDEWEMLFG